MARKNLRRGSDPVRTGILVDPIQNAPLRERRFTPSGPIDFQDLGFSPIEIRTIQDIVNDSDGYDDALKKIKKETGYDLGEGEGSEAMYNMAQEGMFDNLGDLWDGIKKAVAPIFGGEEKVPTPQGIPDVDSQLPTTYLPGDPGRPYQPGFDIDSFEPTVSDTDVQMGFDINSFEPQGSATISNENPEGVALDEKGLLGPAGYDQNASIYNLSGADRNQKPSSGVSVEGDQIAKAMFGQDYGFKTFSGQGILPKGGNANHPYGVAADGYLTYKGERVTDPEKTQQFGLGFIQANKEGSIGVGSGYMSPVGDKIHIQQNKNDYWSQGGSKWRDNVNIMDETNREGYVDDIKDARAGVDQGLFQNTATPTFRPSDNSALVGSQATDSLGNVSSGNQMEMDGAVDPIDLAGSAGWSTGDAAKDKSIEQFAKDRGAHPAAIAGMLGVETGGKFDPSKQGGAGNNFHGINQLSSGQVGKLSKKAGLGELTPKEYRALGFDDQLKVVDQYHKQWGFDKDFFTGDLKTDTAKAWAAQLAPANAKGIDYSNPDAVLSATKQANAIGGRNPTVASVLGSLGTVQSNANKATTALPSFRPEPAGFDWAAHDREFGIPNAPTMTMEESQKLLADPFGYEPTIQSYADELTSGEIDPRTGLGTKATPGVLNQPVEYHPEGVNATNVKGPDPFVPGHLPGLTGPNLEPTEFVVPQFSSDFLPIDQLRQQHSDNESSLYNYPVGPTAGRSSGRGAPLSREQELYEALPPEPTQETSGGYADPWAELAGGAGYEAPTYNEEYNYEPDYWDERGSQVRATPGSNSSPMDQFNYPTGPSAGRGSAPQYERVPIYGYEKGSYSYDDSDWGLDPESMEELGLSDLFDPRGNQLKPIKTIVGYKNVPVEKSGGGQEAEERSGILSPKMNSNKYTQGMLKTARSQPAGNTGLFGGGLQVDNLRGNATDALKKMFSNPANLLNPTGALVGAGVDTLKNSVSKAPLSAGQVKGQGIFNNNGTGTPSLGGATQLGSAYDVYNDTSKNNTYSVANSGNIVSRDGGSGWTGVTSNVSGKGPVTTMTIPLAGGGSTQATQKIVCTAMNEDYGFGSYRNAIWLKYAKDNLTDYHQTGYHAIFKPLLKIGRESQPWLYNTLKHIARHRTSDIRAEMQGSKRDKLGMAYRSVLEPLCYVVGYIKEKTFG
jgi:hypothetical protein